MPQFPSIQSFFSNSAVKQHSCGPSAKKAESSSTQQGDGFTAEEVKSALQPPRAHWSPTQDYEEADIGNLTPGPGSITFMGRIVNVYDQVTSSKRPLAAKGCLKLIVADDTGALTVSF